MPKQKASSNVIAASEISQYAYCPICLHLKRSGAPMHSDRLERGTAEHERKGGRLRLIGRRERLAGRFRLISILSASAAALLLGWILWTHL
jgi:hypothetical protein